MKLAKIVIRNVNLFHIANNFHFCGIRRESGVLDGKGGQKEVPEHSRIDTEGDVCRHDISMRQRTAPIPPLRGRIN